MVISLWLIIYSHWSSLPRPHLPFWSFFTILCFHWFLFQGTNSYYLQIGVTSSNFMPVLHVILFGSLPPQTLLPHSLYSTEWVTNLRFLKGLRHWCQNRRVFGFLILLAQNFFCIALSIIHIFDFSVRRGEMDSFTYYSANALFPPIHWLCIRSLEAYKSFLPSPMDLGSRYMIESQQCLFILISGIKHCQSTMGPMGLSYNCSQP